MSAATPPARALLGLSGPEWAVVAIGLAAATLPNVLPLMVGVLSRQFGIGTGQAGYVISINMGAILAGSLSCMVLTRRFAWATLIWAGLAIMVAGNALTMMTATLPALIATRAVSGLGEGVVGACCYALMGRARLPGRTIALYAGGQGIVGAAGMAALPSLMAAYGWHVFYVLVSAVAVPVALLVPIAVRGTPAASAPPDPVWGAQRRSLAGFGVLAAMLLYFIGIVMVWAFMERLGVARHLGLAALSAALSASALAGMAGSFTVAAIADRIRRGIGLTVGIAVIAISLSLLLTAGFWPYAVAICGIAFAQCYQFPFLFKCLADTDRAGRLALLTPVATGGGLTIAPAIGGFVLEHGGVGMLCTLSIGLASAATALAAVLARSTTKARRILNEVVA